MTQSGVEGGTLDVEQGFVDVVVGHTGEVGPVDHQRARVERCLHCLWCVDVLHLQRYAPPGGDKHGAFEAQFLCPAVAWTVAVVVTGRIEFVERLASVDAPPEEYLGKEKCCVAISGKREVVSGDGNNACRESRVGS